MERVGGDQTGGENEKVMDETADDETGLQKRTEATRDDDLRVETGRTVDLTTTQVERQAGSPGATYFGQFPLCQHLEQLWPISTLANFFFGQFYFGQAPKKC